MSDESQALIKGHEAWRAFVYDDATGLPIKPGSVVIGHPSIGWGRALDTQGILPAEGNLMLANNDADCTHDLQTMFAYRWDTIGAARQAALLDMRYNLGPTGFREFHKMITALFNAQWDVAAAEIRNSLWAQQVGQRAVDVEKMILTGEWLA
jgi:lysozyme